MKIIKNIVYSNTPPKNTNDLWVLLQDDGGYLIKMFTFDDDNIKKWIVIGGRDFSITGDWGDDEKKVINQKVVTKQFQDVDNLFENIHNITDEHIKSTANSNTASHVKLSDDIDNGFDSTQGIAATPKAIKNAIYEVLSWGDL